MRAALALAAGLLAAGGAVAQANSLEPAAALGCLSPPSAQRGTPEYPFAAFKQGLHGRVKVRLRFTGPDLAPAVTVLEQDGDPSFVDAVRAHVRTLRVPCHDRAETPAELDVDHVFRPSDAQPVAPTMPTDPREAARQRQMACMTRVDGALQPDYPQAALLREAQGRVLVQLRFTAPDQLPAVRILPRLGGDTGRPGRSIDKVFGEPLRDWAAGDRLPCLQDGPLTITQVYVFRLDGREFGFKPGLTLRELLPLVRGVRSQRLQLNTTTMGCPFLVALGCRQPNLAHAVDSAGPEMATRAPLLEWLRSVELDLPDRALDSIYGDTLHLNVPCLNIDLNPSGETS